MRSIRTQLAVRLILGTGLLIVLAGIVLQVTIAGWLEREFDRGLEAEARALATLTTQKGDQVALNFADEMMPQFEAPENPMYFELWLDDDRLLERSRSFDTDEARSGRTLPREAGTSDTPRFVDVPLPDGRPGRRARWDFVPQLEDDSDSDSDVPPDSNLFESERAEAEGESSLGPSLETDSSQSHIASILVARERGSLDEKMSGLRWSIVAFTAALLTILGALIAVTLGIGLRPLDQLADQVNKLEADTLDRRLVLPGTPSELAPVVGQINELLSRLETAFRRERQLTSDIAHELKTPIAELRSLCEVGGRWPDDTAAVRSFFEDAHAVGLQMERVVTHLLALARVDEGAEQIRTERVEVSQLLREAWQPLESRAVERNLALVPQVPRDAVILTDPAKLRSILSNLLANGVEYSRTGTAITCRFEASGGSFSLSVSNYPEHLDSADLEAMFERFWRKDAARTGGRNVGLGLAIVDAFARLLKLDVQAQLGKDNLLVITLTGTG